MEKALRALEGVREVSVDLESKLVTVVGTAAIAEGGLPNPQSHSAATAAASAARAAGLLLTMGSVSGLQLGSYDPSAHLNQRAPAPRYCHLPPLHRRLSRHAKRTSGGEVVAQKPQQRRQWR